MGKTVTIIEAYQQQLSLPKLSNRINEFMDMELDMIVCDIPSCIRVTCNVFNTQNPPLVHNAYLYAPLQFDRLPSLHLDIINYFKNAEENIVDVLFDAHTMEIIYEKWVDDKEKYFYRLNTPALEGNIDDITTVAKGINPLVVIHRGNLVYIEPYERHIFAMWHLFLSKFFMQDMINGKPLSKDFLAIIHAYVTAKYKLPHYIINGGFAYANMGTLLGKVTTISPDYFIDAYGDIPLVEDKKESEYRVLTLEEAKEEETSSELELEDKDDYEDKDIIMGTSYTYTSLQTYKSMFMHPKNITYVIKTFEVYSTLPYIQFLKELRVYNEYFGTLTVNRLITEKEKTDIINKLWNDYHIDVVNVNHV